MHYIVAVPTSRSGTYPVIPSDLFPCFGHPTHLHVTPDATLWLPMAPIICPNQWSIQEVCAVLVHGV